MGNVVALQDPNAFRASDGELPHGCSEVWAKQIFGGAKVHFWRADALGYRSACGVVVTEPKLRNGQNVLFGGGTYPKCKRCMNRLRLNGSKW